MAEKIPLSRPFIEDDELKAVIEVLKSGWLTQGPMVEKFEKEFAQYIGSRHAVAVNSCASALFLALVSSGVGKGDEVIVPSFTFVASVNVIILAGATPVFIDVHEETYNMDVSQLEEKVSEKTKAVMPVHIAGLPCEMDELVKVARRHDLVVVEDAAEALGAEYKGGKVGSFGIGCFSFYPSKNITTGEGGMITTDDIEVAEKARVIRGHGIQTSTWMRELSSKPWERLLVMPGYNFRLTDIQAALGLCQLKKLDYLNNLRIQHAEYLTKELAKIDGIVPPYTNEQLKHVYQMYVPRVRNLDRERIVKELRDRGIGASVHFSPPVHQMPYFKQLSTYNNVWLPVTEDLSKSVLTLPLYPSMNRAQLERIVQEVRSIVSQPKP